MDIAGFTRRTHFRSSHSPAALNWALLSLMFLSEKQLDVSFTAGYVLALFRRGFGSTCLF